MSAEETAVQYIEKLLDFHISTSTPPSQFLTWGNLVQCPALLMNSRLNDLDWDTIPGLFDRLDAVKATHMDLDFVSGQWIHESYDVFNLDGAASHNLALIFFLTPNHQACV